MTLDFTQKKALVRSFGVRLAALVLIGAGLLLSLSTQVVPSSVTTPVSHQVEAAQTGVASHCRELDSHPTIRRGDYSVTVSHAQCLLKYHWGQPIEVDWDFGPITEQAVLNVQGHCGLEQDGVVGPHTWRVLHRASC